MVSVIIPTYNYGVFLKECLESVFLQTYKDFEIIVINDCSTDNTNEIIKPFLKEHRLRYIDLKLNHGQAKAKNIGLESAKGEWVAFLDADDRWRSDKLEKQMPLFANSEVGVVYSSASLLDVAGRVGAPIVLKKHRGWITHNLFIDNFICFSSSVVRKKCFLESGYFSNDFPMGIDWDLWLRFSTKYKFDFVDESLVYYRMGHTNQMSKNIEMRFQCSENIMTGFYARHAHLISAKVYKKAYTFTWQNRFIYFAAHDPSKALNYFLKAIRCNPFNLGLYIQGLRVVYKTLFCKKTSA